MLNSYIVYNKLSTNISSPFSISLLEFRAQLATQMINSFSSRKYETSSTSRAGSKRARLTTTNIPLSGHYLARMDNGVRKRCILCTKNGIDNRTNSICFTCNKPFCYTKERNCFEIHHKWLLYQPYLNDCFFFFYFTMNYFFQFVVFMIYVCFYWNIYVLLFLCNSIEIKNKYIIKKNFLYFYRCGPMGHMCPILFSDPTRKLLKQIKRRWGFWLHQDLVHIKQKCYISVSFSFRDLSKQKLKKKITNFWLWDDIEMNSDKKS